MKYIGILKWYDTSKGFGVLSTLLPQKESTLDVFFHHTCWTGKSIDIKPFAFDIRERTRKGGYEAVHCCLFDCSIELWQQIFNNIDYNLIVNTENGSRNILQECVKMIQTSQDAKNFITVCEGWIIENLISKPSDLSDILTGGKDVKVPEFQSFLNSVKASFSFDDRKELFKMKQVDLYAFSDEEAMQILDLINKDDYDTLKNTNPNLYLKILKEKLLSSAKCFNFKYESELGYYSYSKVKTEYETLNDLYADYILCSSENQKREIIEEISSIIINKEVVFQSIVRELVDNSQDASIFVNKFKNLTSFPDCFSTETTKKLIKNAEKIIKEKYDFFNNLKLMSLGVLQIDTEYIEQNFHYVNKGNIQYIVKEGSVFTLQYARKSLFSYLKITKDIDTVLEWYNNRKELQKDDLTELIKSYIENYFLEPNVLFVSKAHNYIHLLGEDFVCSIIKKYLQITHKSETLIKQLAVTSGDYQEKISTLLYSFLSDSRELIDDNYVEPFCSASNKDIHPSLSEDYIVDILKAYIDNIHNYKNALIYAEKYSSNTKKRIETYLFQLLSRDEYMNLWKKNMCNYLPDGYLDFYFDDNEHKYTLAEQWVNNGRVSKDAILSAMIKTLQRIRNITYYRYFRTEFLIYVFLKKKQCENEINSNIDPSKIVLFNWVRNPIFYDYESICKIYVLFPESIQIKLLKFVFLNIAKGELCIKAKDLLKLNSCDPIYMNYSEDDKPVMCLSASVVIKALCTYDTERKFITDKDFYTLVYKSAANGRNTITPIGNFFDECSGKKKRYFPNPYNIDKFIYPVIDHNNRWFIINFEYSPNLVDAVKAIKGRCYLSKYKVWLAPESSFNEIKNFAQENKFLLLNKDETPNYIGEKLSTILEHYSKTEFREAAWNLSELKDCNEDMPLITYCEGRESQKSDEPDVWWCVGHLPCNACTIKRHAPKNWDKYTMFDFCNILGFDLSETNKYGHFKVGSYALFITSINRFNTLLERLICRDCGCIIYPVESNYSVVGATQFHCNNPECNQYHKNIYLNHCYTRNCRGVIDSRDGAKCPNGLIICSTCGTCCTTQMFEQRLLKLQNTGSPFIPQELLYKVQNDEGHINHKARNKKDRFFCHKCGTELIGSPEKTVCQKCGTEINYNTSLISRH